MSEEGTAEVIDQEETKTEELAPTKRRVLSLGEKVKVIDYLRSQVEPIVADSNSAVAAIVSAATGVDLNWQQLKYMIDDLVDMNLGAKVYVKSLVTGVDDDRIAALEARIVQLESRMSVLAGRIGADE